MSTVEKLPSLRNRVSDEEWRTRVNLAACYRLIAMYGWDDLIFTHVSAKVPGPDEHFLINSYGLLFEEMTASSLVKINLEGDKLDSSAGAINPAGFTIHSAIHAARKDVNCIVHTHTRAGIAVSAQQDGLQPLSQIAVVAMASLAYHDYEGIALNDDEKLRLVADLGDKTALILRNHGLLTVGRNIPDTFLAMYALETACQAQVMAQSCGGPLVEVDGSILAGIAEQADKSMQGQGGQLAWPALLRKLDRIDPTFRD
jgi:ribulose-5-phosphate 4-epimerase/fuculose-1-phosphate aldolase